MVGHWRFLRLSRPVSCQAARGQTTQTRNHNNSRVGNERLRRLKRTRRNKLAEDGPQQWHAYVCMIAAAACRRCPWISGMAFRGVARLYPWSTSPSKCGSDVATNVPKQRAITPTERGRVRMTRVPGIPKATRQHERATQVWQRECSAFPAGAEAAINARNRVQQNARQRCLRHHTSL